MFERNMESMRFMNIMTAAEALAKDPFASLDPLRQNQICREHGLILTEMTDEELELLGSLVCTYGNDYYGGCL